MDAPALLSTRTLSRYARDVGENDSKLSVSLVRSVDFPPETQSQARLSVQREAQDQSENAEELRGNCALEKVHVFYRTGVNNAFFVPTSVRGTKFFSGSRIETGLAAGKT